jgi:hypothetical protein
MVEKWARTSKGDERLAAPSFAGQSGMMKGTGWKEQIE